MGRKRKSKKDILKFELRKTTMKNLKILSSIILSFLFSCSLSAQKNINDITEILQKAKDSGKFVELMGNNELGTAWCTGSIQQGHKPEWIYFFKKDEAARTAKWELIKEVNLEGTIVATYSFKYEDYDKVAYIKLREQPNKLSIQNIDDPKISEIKKVAEHKLGYYSYEPAISTISGIVRLEKFYGRFNFGGSPESDEREDSWILYPENPLNMNQSSDIESNNEKIGVTTIHLTETKGLDLASYDGKVLLISGSLSGAISGHHHAKVIMNVLKVKVDENKSFMPLYRDAITNYQKIVRDWNDAHNSKNSDMFSALFSREVEYYHTVLPKNVCIQKKKDLFRKYPDFNQQITGEIGIERLQENEIKCSFTKQVVINQKTTYYPSYLILKKSDVNWEITVEGDLVTDKNIAKKKSSTITASEYFEKGYAKSELKDYAGAIVCFTKAIELDPLFVKAYSNRGNAKGDFHDYKGAITDYSKVIEINPYDAQAYFRRGILKLSLGQKNNGCLDLHKAKELGYEKAEGWIQEECQ